MDVRAGEAHAVSQGSLLQRAFTDAMDGVEVGAEGDEPHRDVLDAAFDLFCRRGIQRTTMDDVAKAAGLSRITVYRRVASKEALVERVVLREFRRYFAQFLVEIGRADNVADRVVAGFVGSLRAIRHNPLIEGLMTNDPDLLVPSVLGEGGTTLRVVSHFLAGQLRREQAAGNVGPEVDVDLVAELMVRMSTSFLLTPSEHVDLDDEGQVADIARRFLVPMLQA